MSERVCHACGARAAVGDPVPRDATCGPCGADLRACINCRHWDPRLHNECRETEAEAIADHRRRNFCEFFDWTSAPFAGPDASARRAQEARAKLDALFGGKGAGASSPAAPAPASDARAKLEALFRKRPAADEGDED